jgi:hypothetical protein
MKVIIHFHMLAMKNFNDILDIQCNDADNAELQYGMKRSYDDFFKDSFDTLI